MTDRIPLDHLTSDQYDALCERLEAAERETTATATAAAHMASLILDRAERAEAALARVQALAEEYPAGIDTALIHAALDPSQEQQP